MKAKTKRQVRDTLVRGVAGAKKAGVVVAEVAEVVADETQRAVKRYRRKQALKKAGRLIVQTATAAAATVAAERLAEQFARRKKAKAAKPATA